MSGEALHRVVDRMFYTKWGATAVSIVFGFALAIMFQRVCKDNNCIVIRAPPMKDIQSSVFQVKPGECYRYTTSVVPCA